MLDNSVKVSHWKNLHRQEDLKEMVKCSVVSI